MNLLFKNSKLVYIYVYESIQTKYKRMANDYNLCNHSYQWVYSYAMINPAEKKIKHLKKVITDPDGYNTN